jgi:MurNAc alpha-1-phosphate uridylyltransferase
MTQMPLMLFAAGFGSRMRPLTDTHPKPLIPVAGLPLIDHALRIAREAGCGPVVINTHYLGHQIEMHLQGQPVRFSREAKLLETGGGLRAALPLLGEGPVMVLNSDAVWTGLNPLIQLAKVWDPTVMDALILTLPAAETTGHSGKGDFIADARGRLTRALGRPGDVYLGAQILTPAALHTIPQASFSLNLLWDQVIVQSRLFGLRHSGGWCDVGRPESIALAEAMLRGTD